MIDLTCYEDELKEALRFFGEQELPSGKKAELILETGVP
jgi:hypothetical protein